jgi:hypothetical protein
MKTKSLFFALAFFLSLAVFSSCDKSSSTARLQIALVDATGDYEEVNVNVVGVEISKTSNGSEGWESLPVEPKTYDLLKLTGGQEALLVDTDIPAGGKIHQIRLILADGNTVKIEGQMNPLDLETPSAQTSGLKLNIQQEVEADLIYKIVLDFDVAKSIVVTGGGKYILKPVIRTFLEAYGGSLKGTIETAECLEAVVNVAEAGSVTAVATTSTNDQGQFLIKGLEAGTYDVTITPSNGNCVAKTISVTIEDGQVNNINVSFP